MADPRPMPRQAVVLAGALIVISALAGLAFGAVGDIKGKGGLDPNGGDVVEPIKTVANATPLIAPPVTEADVRRWAREELQVQHVAATPKRPRSDFTPDSQTDTGDTLDASGAPSAPTAATPPKPPVAAPPAKPASGQQIPF